MSALMVISIFSLALLPLFTNDNDNDVEPTPDEEVPEATNGNDLIEVSDGETVNGLAGNDILDVFGNDATVDGGTGSDTFNIDGSNNTAIGDSGGATGPGSSGDDIFNVGGSNNFLDGGNSNDTFNLFGDNNTADGGSGQDTLDILGSNNIVNGGNASDTFIVDGSNNTANGDDGDDKFVIFGENTTASGDDGNDVFDVNATNAIVDGGGGSDSFFLTGDSIRADGGSGDDSFSAFGNNITVNGGAGDDQIENADTATGFTADGGTGADTLTSSHVVNLETQDHSLTGGAGADTFRFDLRAEGSTVSNTQGEIATVTDFDRTQDALEIEIRTSNNGFTFDGLDFAPAADGSYTDIIVTLAPAAQGSTNAISTIRVEGIDDLGLEDIALTVGGQAVILDTLLEEDEPTVLPATATLNAATNTVTVEADPEETGTILTVANRVDAVNGDGSSNFIYETSVILVPEGIDIETEFDALEEANGTTFYSDILTEIGATELGFWAFDPAADEGEEGAIPDFVYPDGADTEFVQIYSTNFGDGGQIDAVVDVAGEGNLTDGIEDYVSDFIITQVDGGAVVTVPTDFSGELAILETTKDFFFEGQLVRTDVTVATLAVDAGTDFTASTIALADEVTQTPTDAGSNNVITDGSLTEEEFFLEVPGTEFQGSFGVSVTEFDTNGNLVSEQGIGDLGTSANADITRYAVRVTSAAIPASGENGIMWEAPSRFAGVVTSFGTIENVPTIDPQATAT